jgi:CRISPR/Cas system CMR-associated protein Cmr5 small subunit
MQNLDQIRAAKALETAKETTRQDVSKLPAIIITNGLLAAAAFADEEKESRIKMGKAMAGVAEHLANPVLGITVLRGKTTTKDMISALSTAPATSLDLQRATAEALAFLAYVKRFAEKE